MRILFVYPLLILFSLSLSASPLNEALMARYNEDARVSFLAGQEEYTALRYPATISMRRGIAVVLAEIGYQGLTVQSGELLAQRMRRWGWDVVVVPVVYPPSEESADEAITSNPFSDNTGRWLNAETSRNRLASLTTSVLNQFSDKPGYRLIICQGMTAAQMLQLTALEQLATPDAFVVLAPFWPEAEQNRQIARWIADTPIPVLDIAGALSNHWSAKTVAQRSDNARVGLKMDYRQRQLPEASAGAIGIQGHTSPFVTRLSKEIYGWTRYLGW